MAVILGMSVAPAQAAANDVTINGQTLALTGVNVYRSTNAFVQYTPAYGATTGTNIYGYEAAVVGGVITKAEDGVGNMAIPANGYVLSGHGTSRTWLKANAKVGATVTIGGTPPPPPSGATELLPDTGIRTLRQFTIVNTGGKKLLKFPGVTANVGKGPLEILGKRSSSTSTDWVANQVVYMSDGTKKTLPAAAATFYYAGDGHTHWHIKDFDAYELFDPSGKKLRDGEKHGFCFEDNTSYRNWPGNPSYPASPLNPVYTHDNVCGVGDPTATSIMHGLSVGWSDTYPSTLPDQAIDITGLPDGVYTVKVTADWQNFWKETNENNNSASAKVQISGDTVKLNSATDGL
jgi:hypothetical protein